MSQVPQARRRPSIVLLFTLVFAAFALSPAYAQTTAGTVTEQTGSANVQRGTTTSPVTLNMAVLVGDRLSTGAGSHLAITLTDASKLLLGESSVLVIDEHILGPGGSRQSTRLSLFSGLVHSVVNLTTSGAPNFEVHTPNAVAAARATEFGVRYEEGSTRSGYTGCNRFTDVGVYKGTVGVRQAATPSAPEVLVPEGYESTVPCGLAPMPPGPLGMTGAGGTSASAASGGGGGLLGAIGAAPAPVGAPPPSCPVCPPGR